MHIQGHLPPAVARVYQTTPVGADAHHDVPLSNLAVAAFAAADDNLVAEGLFPAVPVGKQSNQYYVISRNEFWRLPQTGLQRAPRTEPRRVQFTVSSEAYYAHNYALAAENALEDMENQDIAIQLRQNSTKLVTGLLRLDQEVRIADLVTSISNVGSGVQLTGADKWGDASSDPIGAVNTGHAFMRSQTGLVANTAVIDWDTMQVVRRHPAMIDLFKHTTAGELTMAQIADVFKVDRILVGMALRENAVEGGTSSVTNVWGNNVVLAHVGPSTGLQSMTLGLRLQWRNPIFPADFGVATNREDRAGQRKVEVLEAGHYQDEKIVAADLAYVIADTI